MIGDTFVTADSTSDVIHDADLLDHESRHSEQWAGFGAVNFMASYVANSAVSGMVVGDRACANYFEADAGFREGGYDFC
ncbi:hypothetical protein [Microbacterium testaceum]|uniref:hypothetical protein n=1 Tax=Microbacterium testaceum TaxID=2033 RepID=UPI000A908182|nr:hypothetical protein [Microbacterium testaceum]